MIRFAAINSNNYNSDSDYSDQDSNNSDYDDTTDGGGVSEREDYGVSSSSRLSNKFDSMSNEAQETYNLKLYQNALKYQQANDFLQAQQLYQELLQSPLIARICPTTSKKSILSSSMASLKYLTLKNIALINEQIGNKEHSLKLLTEAVDLDARDVSMWYSIGKISMDLEKWNISRFALERAIQISSTHWLSLERLIELLYVIGDDNSCIHIINTFILIEQPNHLKSIIIRSLIQRNDPSKFNEIYQILNYIDKSCPDNKNYIQSLIKKREKIQLNKSLINNNKLTTTTTTSNTTTSTTLDTTTTVYTLNTQTWNSLLDLLNLIYKEKKEDFSSSLSIFSPIEINLNPNLLIVNNNNSNSSNSNDIQPTATIDIDMIDETEKITESTTNTTTVPTTTDTTTAAAAAAVITTIINDDKRPISPAPTLNSSSGSIPNNNKNTTTSAAATTTTTTITSRRMETRSKASSKNEDKQIESEDYLEKLINTNRPINQEIMNQLNSNEQLTNSGNDTIKNFNNNEKEKQKQQLKNTTTTTTTTTKSTFEANEKQSIFKYLNRMNQLTRDNPSSIISVIEWISEALNIISFEANQFNLPNLIYTKIFKSKLIIDQHTISNSNQYQDYYLLLSELSFDKFQSFLNEKKKKQKLTVKPIITTTTAASTSTSSTTTPSVIDLNDTSTDNQTTVAAPVKETTTTTPKLKENDDAYQPNQELSNLSYYIQILNLKKLFKPFNLLKENDESSSSSSSSSLSQESKEKIEKELLFEIRYKWLLANYNLVIIGDINMATLYFKECELLFEDFNKRFGEKESTTTTATTTSSSSSDKSTTTVTNNNSLDFIIINHCKFDRIVSPLILSDKISHLQDQQEKNSAGQLFNSKNYESVITLLEPLFPDSLCILEFNNNNNNTNVNSLLLEFNKNKDHMDTETKSRLNRIDLLIHSYLNLSNIKGVLKMSIILMKEISNFNNQHHLVNLINEVFKHENMKPKNKFDETESTLLSILVRLIYKYYKKNVSYSNLMLLLNIYQFDESKKLKPVQLIPIYSVLHSELAKKKQCLSEPNFMLSYMELLFRLLINDGNSGNLNLSTSGNSINGTGSGLNDNLSASSSSVGANGDKSNENAMAVKLITELCQCFNCLHSIKLMNSLEDHQISSTSSASTSTSSITTSTTTTPSTSSNKNNNIRKLKGPGIYMQLFILIKLLNGEEEDITNIPLNPSICNEIVLGIIQQKSNDKEIKDQTEKIYSRFPIPPPRVTRYKSLIDDYMSGKTKDLTDDQTNINRCGSNGNLDSNSTSNSNSNSAPSSPFIINLDLLFLKDDQVDIDNPIFDDIFTDIYYMYALELEKGEDIDQHRSLLIKDLYCNPNRIDSWQKLSKSYGEDLKSIADSDGILIRYSNNCNKNGNSNNNNNNNNNDIEIKEIDEQDEEDEIQKEIEEEVAIKIERLYKKCKLVYKQIIRLTPKDESYRDLAFLIFEKHYFLNKNNSDSREHKRKLESIFKRSLFYLEKAIESERLASPNSLENWFYQVFKSKLERKLGKPPSVYLETLNKTIQNLPPMSKTKTNSILPLYRLHTDRLKLLLPFDKCPIDNDLITTLEKYDYISTKSSTNNNSTLIDEWADYVTTTATTTTTTASTTDAPTSDEDESNVLAITTDDDDNDDKVEEKDQNNNNNNDNNELKTTTTLSSNAVVQQQKQTNSLASSTTEATNTKPTLSLEERRDLLIENSLSALNAIRTLVTYHHQASYRIAWTIRNNTRKENYITNSLAEFIKNLRPKLSRLSKACVWSLWNDEYVGDGKLDRYFAKYYKLFIQLLEENRDIKNLEIIYFKIKNDPKFLKEANQCFLSCCKALSNIIKLKQQQQQQQQQTNENQSSSTSTSTNTTTTTSTTSSTTTTSTSSTSTTTPLLELDSILKYEYEFYLDLSIFPKQKSVIQKLIMDTWIYSNQTANSNSQSPKKSQPTFDEVISALEKKFSRNDKRSRKRPTEDNTNSKKLKMDENDE